jgi:hypothetical protein
MRLVCRRFVDVASPLADRYIRYPITDLDPVDIRARARAVKLLSHVDSLSAISRVTVSGVNNAKRTDYEAQEQILKAHMVVLSEALQGASKLKHVTARTPWRMTRFLLEKLAHWPRIQSLDVLVSGQASCLAFGRMQTLTLRLVPHCADRRGPLIHRIPALPELSRLKLESVWPREEWSRPVFARFNFGRYPKLTVLKLCGEAPPRYVHMFTGKTTSIKRCIIGDEHEPGVKLGLQLLEEVSTFFSRFAEGLEALTVNFGVFNDISSSFPNLRSLKLVSTIYSPFDTIINIKSCPVTQLSLVCRGRTRDFLSKSIETFVPRFAATLQHLQLVRDPTRMFNAPPHTIRTLSWEATRELVSCQNLKYLEIYGLLSVPWADMQTIGRAQPDLQGVMMTFPAFGEYRDRAECKVSFIS